MVRAEDLAGIAEIAERFGVTRQAVANWRVRYEDFPEPVIWLACGPIFDMPTVEKWFASRSRS